ncbi:uncharacterized protein LOC142771488 [Rhipicephalus microplus]|uniref:uncharacterized protein LOC142771488 n=1 Tax=Rhipicephalus microplus TaxID=6941 RepID=UPI003F6BC9E1
MEVDVPTVVTRLCTSVAAGAKSDLPPRELKKLAFSFLLKLHNRAPLTHSPDCALLLSSGTWPVEDRIAAEAFAWHLQGRQCEALQLRECLARLKKHHYSSEVRVCLEFLLHLAHSGAINARRRLFELPPYGPAKEQLGLPALMHRCWKILTAMTAMNFKPFSKKKSPLFSLYTRSVLG